MTELGQQIEARYGLRVAEQSAPLSGGYENDVVRIATSHGRFAVRICAPWISTERVVAEHGVLEHMAERIDEVHAAVPAQDGSTWFVHDDRVVSVFPFFPGRSLHRDDDQLRRKGAELLARIHRTGMDYTAPVALPPLARLDWEHNELWDLGRVRDVIAALAASESFVAQEFAAAADRVEAEQRWAHERVTTLDESFAAGIVQGDYWPGNILVEHGHITAVLDWLESRRETLVVELGRATWEFCSDRNDHALLRDRADDFLDAYHAAGGPVGIEEFDVLVDTMRVHVLGDMLRDLTYTDPEESAAYHLGSLRRLEHLSQL